MLKYWFYRYKYWMWLYIAILFFYTYSAFLAANIKPPVTSINYTGQSTAWRLTSIRLEAHD